MEKQENTKEIWQILFIIFEEMGLNVLVSIFLVMSNDCEYRGVCKDVLDEIGSDCIFKNPFLSSVFFYANFGQNFGPCSSKKPNCRVYRINRRIENELKRSKIINEKNQSILLKTSLMKFKS
ncbi:MAG: hypothetical protein GTN36_04550 [Candidatus Aenigmarchaeota archaeon]|nr:hypothetical protein [Candidatus Aenigmarchaeota archaeon]